MRTFTTVWIIVCLLSLLSAPAKALTLKKDIRLAKGEFEVPAEIKKQIKVTGLQSFLDSKSEFTRMAAVRRLAEIEGPKAVGLLHTIFAKEPAASGLHDLPLVKFEVIRTLGTVGTEQAKSTLLGMLISLWEKGPILSEKKNAKGYSFNEKRYYYLDRDFTTVMPLLLQTLYKWSGEEDVFKTVETIALSEDVKKFYTQRKGIGQKAWEVYLKGKIIREGIVEDEQAAIYLLEFLEQLRKQSSYGKHGYIQDMAGFAVLQKHNKTVLSSLAEKLEKELRKEDALGPDSERNDRLEYMIICIRGALQEKEAR